MSAPGSRWAKCTAAATIDEGHVPDDLGITRNVGLAAHLVKDRVPIDRFTRLHYMPYPRGVPRGNASLPELGAWDGPVYGELGVLVADGDRLVCHACGELFRGLGYHAVRPHQLTADAYRAVFGLRASTSLIGPALKARRREIARDTLAQFGGRYSGIAGLTFEDELRRAMDGLGRGVFPMEQLVTHRFGLDEIGRGIEAGVSRTPGYIKGVVIP